MAGMIPRTGYITCDDAREWLTTKVGQADLVLTDPPHLDNFGSVAEHRHFVSQWLPLALEARQRYGTLYHSCGQEAKELQNYLSLGNPDQIRVWPHEGGFHYHLIYGDVHGQGLVKDAKPKPLWDNIIADYTDDRALVIDPFCGRGEIPDAARRMQCYYRGCDINADSVAYCINELKL